MLRLIPRYPAKKTASEIHTRLVGVGYDVTKRTVERDLSDLTRRFRSFRMNAAGPVGGAGARTRPI